MLSHVPGGLGVFEAVILLACGGRAPPEQIIGALVLYRIVYYLLPLIAAAMLLAAYELRSGVAAPIRRAAVAISSLLLATLTFIAGAWLLVSGVTPLSVVATDLLELHVPLPLVEASHFIGSVAGFAMLVIARGLLNRLDAAWWAAFLLALIAAVLAMPKGIVVSEGAFLTVLAFLLLASRRQFERRSALFSQALGGAWILSIAWVVAACVLILLLRLRKRLCEANALRFDAVSGNRSRLARAKLDAPWIVLHTKSSVPDAALTAAVLRIDPPCVRASTPKSLPDYPSSKSRRSSPATRSPS